MTGSDHRLDLQIGLSAAFAALIAYATAVAGTFVYDDVHSVMANPGVHSLANLPRFFIDPGLFSGNGAEMYRPVLLCTFAIDHALGGGAALPFKLTSMLLHAAAVWLLFRLMRGHGVGPAAAGIAAAWFGLHPLASETVNMVSSRSEGLLVVGVLLALVSHLRALRGRRWGGVGMALGVIVACGSKETGVVVPALLVLQEWLCGDRGVALRARAATAARRLLPVAALVLAYLIARKVLLGQATASLLGRDGSDPLYGHTRDLITQLATMAAALPRLLARIVVPFGLTADVPVVYHRSLLDWPVLVGGTSLLLGSALLARHGRRRPAATFGVAMVWAIALPWILIPLNVPIAEHRVYGSLAGMALVLAAALDRLPVVASLVDPALAAARSGRARLSLWIGGAGLAALAAASMLRSLDYRDEAVLWQSALAVDPQSFRAHWSLGSVYQRRGDHERAQQELAAAVALYPTFRGARRDWVQSLLQLPPAEGWSAVAVAAAAELTRQKDDDPYYRLLHANALLVHGKFLGDRDMLAAAEARVLSCHEVGAPRMTVFRMAAECRQLLGDPAGALAHFDAAIAQGFDRPGIRALRSDILRELGQPRLADSELQQAFRAAPSDPIVQWVWSRRQAAAPR